MPDPTTTQKYADLERRELNILRQQDLDIGRFLDEAEATLKAASAYTKPLPGGNRLVAVLAGMRDLAARARVVPAACSVAGFFVGILTAGLGGGQ